MQRRWFKFSKIRREWWWWFCRREVVEKEITKKGTTRTHSKANRCLLFKTSRLFNTWIFLFFLGRVVPPLHPHPPQSISHVCKLVVLVPVKMEGGERRLNSNRTCFGEVFAKERFAARKWLGHPENKWMDLVLVSKGSIMVQSACQESFRFLLRVQEKRKAVFWIIFISKPNPVTICYIGTLSLRLVTWDMF